MSFRARVAVLIATVVAVVVAVVAGTFLYMARARSLHTLDDTLRDRAALVVQLGDKLGRPQEFDRRLFGIRLMMYVAQVSTLEAASGRATLNLCPLPRRPSYCSRQFSQSNRYQRSC